jgi:hypothetical protein
VPRRLTVITAALLAALALVACGGDDNGQYKEDVQSVSRELVALGSEVGKAIQTAADSSDQQLAKQFDDFAGRLGDIRKELQALEPPDDLADQQDELVAATGEVRGSLEDIADAAKESDVDAARQAAQELVQRSADLRDARRSLARSAADL